MTLRTAIFAGLWLIGSASVFAEEVFTDDFEGGTNHGAWSFNVTTEDIIESDGGNPGGWLHNDFVDSFAPIVSLPALLSRSSANAF